MSAEDYNDFRAEDPPEGYLAAEAERVANWHSQDVHGGGVCDCPAAHPATGERPF